VSRDRLIEEVRAILAKTGFFASDRPGSGSRGLTFDVVARRDETLLLIKVLQNIDAFARGPADELKMLATVLEGAPLLVGERSGGGPLEEGVIYSRFGVPILSLDTFRDFFVEGVPPFIFSAPGGLYVRLDDGALRRLREERNISLGALAEVAGVSRRTIQMYLEGMSATVDVALRLEDFLGEPLVLAVDPFSYSRDVESLLSSFEDLVGFEKAVFGRLRELGYDVLPTVRCPFDAFTQDRQVLLLTGIGQRGERIEEKARMVANLSRIVEQEAVLFLERRSVKVNIRGAPVIGRDELRRIRDRDEILELIHERKE
jgi:putative transcriptional regulator